MVGYGSLELQMYQSVSKQFLCGHKRQERSGKQCCFSKQTYWFLVCVCIFRFVCDINP